MASRRARRANREAKDTARTTAARRVDTARTEMEHRSLLAAAEPYRGLPIFRAVALDLGVVPDPAPVPESAPVPAWIEPTGLVPVVQPGSLLGLMDGETR